MATPLSGIDGIALVAGLASSVISGAAALTKLGAIGAGESMALPFGNGQPPEPMQLFTGAGTKDAQANPLATLFTAPSKIMSDISIQTSKLLSPIQSMNNAFANTLSSAFTAFTPQITMPTPQSSSPSPKSEF